jgi:hypothetical protein
MTSSSFEATESYALAVSAGIPHFLQGERNFRHSRDEGNDVRMSRK